MDKAPSNVLIEASAGTGKTQSLGMRLIELLKAGVKPHEIVALTFSRAAAGEIFERFVSLLAESAATSPADAKLLRSVIATQHLSQIGTLDSFLMKVVKAFPDEIGLDGEMEIMDEYAAASERSSVSFSILRRTDMALKRNFIEAFLLAMNGEDVRSFTASYRDFIKAWHERVAAMPGESSWGDPGRIWGRDPAFAHVAEKELSEAADRVVAVLGSGGKWGEFAEWVRAFRGSFGGAKGYAKKFLEAEDFFEGDAYSFKFGRSEVTLSRDETLAARDAMACVFGYVVRMKLELARGIYRLISAFEKEYDRKVRRAGRLVFSDIPRLVAGLSPDVRAALEYRADCRIRAWALDEFQDTSRAQWNAIANLIDEAKQSDGEKSVFIVGDRKQAIYGWRDGDVGIFAEELASGFYTPGELSKSYRSGPAVIEAVNRVFARGRILSEFPAWKSPEHETAKTGVKGFVRVVEAEARSVEAFARPVLDALAATLGMKASDPRRRGVAAAVLVRTRDFGRFLANSLKSAGFEGVAWEGDSSVMDTTALAPFLDLVQLADHPADMMTYRHFRMTRLAEVKYPGGIPSAAAISAEMSALFSVRGLVRTFRELRALLPEDPSEAWSEFTEERFTEMLRAAAAFELSASPASKMSDFAAFFAARVRRDVADEGCVRIMTIHRSKGLGFDYVVLPLYEFKPLAVDPGSPIVGDGWILPPMDARVVKAVGGLGDAYRLRRDRAEQEALCMYYVAMTRAKKAMTIVLSPPGGGAESLRFSDIVRSAGLGDLVHPETATLCDEGNASEAAPAAALEPSPPRRRERFAVRRRLPSKGFATGMSAGSLFSADGGRRAAMARGEAAHAMMEKVEFSDELPRPPGFVALWRERAFEVFDGGEWISGRFDRVTFFRNAEGELCAEIVDFKSSLRDSEKYDAQLATYRRAVSALTAIPLSRISARLSLLPAAPQAACRAC